MKTCLRCQTPKELGEFGKETKRSDGLRPYCKECCKAMTAEYRQSDEYREVERAYSRQYNQEHKEERHVYRLEYESRTETKSLIRTRSRGWFERSPEKKILYSARARAKKYNLSFNLELRDIVIPERCPILGIKLCKGEGCVTDASPSIDQIVPAAGYIKGNVHIISHRANTIKSNATLAELKKIVAWLETIEVGREQSALSQTSQVIN